MNRNTKSILKSIIKEIIAESLSKKPDELEIEINGATFYFRKVGDKTHFKFSDDRQTWNVKHIDQIANKPYYQKVFNWLNSKQRYNR